MCETITKAYVPHNVGKEQGPLNLKVEERDLWGGESKTKLKEHLAKAGGGGRANLYFVFICFNKEPLAKAGRGGSSNIYPFWGGGGGDPPLQIHIRSLCKRLGGRIEGERSTLALQISILWQRLRGRVYQKKTKVGRPPPPD